MVWLVVGGGIIIIILAIMMSRARVPHDGVDNFRRQIDALSPEARRPVVGRVNEARHNRRDDGITTRPVTSVTPAGGISRKAPDQASDPADDRDDLEHDGVTAGDTDADSGQPRQGTQRPGSNPGAPNSAPQSGSDHSDARDRPGDPDAGWDSSDGT